MLEGTVTYVPAAERVRAKRAALARHPLVAGCSPLTVRRLSSVCDEVRVPAGDVIVEQGRHGLWFFLIDSGRAELVRDGHHAGELGPGQHFGEAAVLRQVLQPATVRAVSDMTLFVIGCQRLVPLVRDTRLLRRRLGDVVARPRPVLRSRSAGLVAWVERPQLAHPRRPAPVARRTTRRWVLAGAVVLAIAAAALWHPPVAVVAPGRAFDVSRDITITGVPTTPVHGRYLASTVRASHPSLLGLGIALLHPHRRIVDVDEAFPPGANERTLRSRGEAAFRRSQGTAAATALRAAGLSPDSGVAVRFRPRAVSGPSAGLAYALAIEDMLDSADRASGRTIAATGEVGPDGRVRPVGYVAQKAAAAKAVGGTFLLVPDVEVTEAWGSGLDVRGVGSMPRPWPPCADRTVTRRRWP